MPGIVDEPHDAITFMCPGGVEYVRTGLGAKGGIEPRMGHEQPALLLLPMKDNGANARKLIFAHLTTDGLQMQPTGTGAVKAHGVPPAFAAVVRPTQPVGRDSVNNLCLYSPNWRLAENNEARGIYSQVLAQLEGNFLALIASRAAGQTTRAWLWAPASVVNTEYGLSDA